MHRPAGVESIELTGEDMRDLEDHAVLVRTDHSVHFGTEAYAVDHPHLTALEQPPEDGFTFTAVPPKIEGAGTFTVRAFATLR